MREYPLSSGHVTDPSLDGAFAAHFGRHGQYSIPDRDTVNKAPINCSSGKEEEGKEE